VIPLDGFDHHRRLRCTPELLRGLLGLAKKYHSQAGEARGFRIADFGLWIFENGLCAFCTPPFSGGADRGLGDLYIHFVLGSSAPDSPNSSSGAQFPTHPIHHPIRRQELCSQLTQFVVRSSAPNSPDSSLGALLPTHPIRRWELCSQLTRFVVGSSAPNSPDSSLGVLLPTHPIRRQELCSRLTRFVVGSSAPNSPNSSSGALLPTHPIRRPELCSRLTQFVVRSSAPNSPDSSLGALLSTHPEQNTKPRPWPGLCVYHETLSYLCQTASFF
jgi:hypothetical protein